MTREEFIAKYGKTFVADDKGGNAASEVAGQDVGSYYDMFLGPDAKTTMTVGGWDNPNETPIQWGQNRYSDSNPAFDAWYNVDPHPESNRGNGLDEAWKAVGRPLATMAAMYGGINALGGLGAGSDVASFDLGQTAGFDAVPVEGSSFGSGIGGDLLASTPGYESALSGGALGSAGIGSSLMPAASGGGLLETLKGAGSFLKGNSGLAQLGGAALGALASGDTQTSATSSKDPWGPAQSYLKDNLATNAAMQAHYAANPFSTEQKTAYQGLLNTLANNQANAPGLLANANSFGQSSRGKMPAMQGLLSGTQAAPIDWASYSGIGKR